MAVSNSWSSVITANWANLLLFLDHRQGTFLDYSRYARSVTPTSAGGVDCQWHQDIHGKNVSCGGGGAPGVNGGRLVVGAAEDLAITEGTLMLLGNWGRSLAQGLRLAECRAVGTYFDVYVPLATGVRWADASGDHDWTFPVPPWADTETLAFAIQNGVVPTCYHNGISLGAVGAASILANGVVPALHLYNNNVGNCGDSWWRFYGALFFSVRLTPAEILQLHSDFTSSGGSQVVGISSNTVVDYYVSTTGSDADDGSLAHPWETIQHAVDTVSPNTRSVINLMGGPFREHVLIDSKSYITIRPLSAPVLVDGSYTSAIFPVITDNWAVFKIIASDYIRIEDLIITNSPGGHCYTGCNPLYYPSPLGIQVMTGSKSISIVNNVITHVDRITETDCGGWGHGGSLPILVTGETLISTSEILIYGNTISDCDTSPDAYEEYSQTVTIIGNVEYFSVVNNTLADLDSSGISMCGGYYPALGVLDCARNGLVSQNNCDNITTEAIYVNGGKEIVIERNFIIDCDQGISAHTEVAASARAKSIRARNNIIVNCWVGFTTGQWEPTYGDVEKVEFFNNTLINCDVGMEIMPCVFDSFITNNIIDCWAAKGPGLGPIIWNAGVGDTVTLDNNMWYIADGDPAPARFFLGVYPPGVAKTFAEYKAATGQDAASYFEPAHFSSAYRLGPPSSAIGNGSTVLHVVPTSIPCGFPWQDDTDPYGVLDYYGEPRQTGGSIDIGASEYQGP